MIRLQNIYGFHDQNYQIMKKNWDATPEKWKSSFYWYCFFSVSFFCIDRIKIAPDCTRWFVERSEERIWIHKPWVLMCCRQGWANGGLIFLICCQQPWTIFLFTAITHFQLKADVIAHLSLLWSIGWVALSSNYFFGNLPPSLGNGLKWRKNCSNNEAKI